MTTVRKRWSVGAAACSALLAMTLAGCGSSGSTADSGATTPAAATGPKLDLAAVKAISEKPDFFTVWVLVEADDGDGEQRLADYTLTVDRKNNTSAIKNASNPLTGQASNRLISSGNDLYVDDLASDRLTKITLDPSLTAADPNVPAPTSIIDLVDKLDVDLHQDGTTEQEGETLKHYRANVDGEKLLSLLTRGDEMKKLASSLPDFEDLVGSVEIDVTDDGGARFVKLLLAFDVEDVPSSLSMSAYFRKSTDGSVEVPDPAEIAATKHVTTADELASEIRATSS